MSGIRALLRLQLWQAFRDPGFYVSLLLLLVMVWMTPGAQALVTDAITDLTEKVASDEGPQEADPLPSFAVVGQWPAEVSLPSGSVARKDAEVLIHVAPQPQGYVELRLEAVADVSLNPLVRALRASVAEARQDGWTRRAADPERVQKRRLEFDWQEPEEAGWSLWDGFSMAGLVLGSMALLLGTTGSANTLPELRQSGFMELAGMTATRRGALIFGWWGALWAIGNVLLWVCAGALWLGSFWGDVGGWETAVHAMGLLALGDAIGMRVSMTARDAQAGSLRSIVLLMGTSGLMAASALAHLWGWSWVGLLIPIGGSWWAALGYSGDLGAWAWLALPASLLWTVPVLWSCVLVLDAEGSSRTSVDAVLIRQGRGNYLPEAMLLGGCGMSAALLQAVMPFSSTTASLLVAFVALMVLPAVLAPAILGLDRNALLGLQTPTWRTWGLSIPVLFALLAASEPVLSATAALLPESVMLGLLELEMAKLLGEPLGWLALGVLPGICEELLFRGAIQGLLLRSGRPRLANVVQALLFGLAHGMALRLPWTFLVGLTLGELRQRSGSVWPGVVVHVVFNCALGLLAVYGFELASLGWTVWLAVPGVAALWWVRR